MTRTHWQTLKVKITLAKVPESTSAVIDTLIDDHLAGETPISCPEIEREDKICLIQTRFKKMNLQLYYSVNHT